MRRSKIMPKSSRTKLVGGYRPDGIVDGTKKPSTRVQAASTICQAGPSSSTGELRRPTLHLHPTATRPRLSTAYTRFIEPPTSTLLSIIPEIADQEAVRSTVAHMEDMPLQPPQMVAMDMMSIDEFDKAHPYTPPPAKMTPLTASSVKNGHSDIFNMVCQAKGLLAYFRFESPSPMCWTAVVLVNKEVLTQAGPFSTKKEAKEAVCEAAIPMLQLFPNLKERKRREMLESHPANTGEHSSQFLMRCQEKGIAPDISFTEPSKGSFIAKMEINGQLVGQSGPCASKKVAKDEVCKVALPKFFPSECQNTKRKSSVLGGQLQDVPVALEEQNWIGTLVEHCQQSKIPYPIYTESTAHPSHGPFSCSVQFSGSPPNGFGATSGPFKKKADAKKNAAMEAILWLRYEGKLVGPNKRRKSAANPDTLTSQETGLTQDFTEAMDISAEDTAKAGSIGKQVGDLCLQLGLTNPTFEVVPVSEAFYNVHAIFTPQNVRYEPRLAGNVAPVYNVRGKKAAKEECWRELWNVLEDIRRSRAG